MSLTKEECLEAYEVIDTLIHLMCGETREDGYEPTMDEMVNSMKKIEQLINEHFDNQPLKFEELKENTWVWDSKYNEWCYIYFISDKYPHRKYIDNCISDGIFEENRFYTKEVKI